MNQSDCPPLAIQKIFHNLLTNPTSLNSSDKLAGSPQSPRLTSPPAKNTIRYIEGDQNNRREKYDGCRWRLACTWNLHSCPNLAGSRQLCAKHNLLQRNKKLPQKKKKKLLTTNSSLPIINHTKNDDNDIIILEEYCKKPNNRHSMNNAVKSEMTDFNIFSVENLDNTDFQVGIHSTPRASTDYKCTTSNDVEYIKSTIRNNGLNITELIMKNIPPLTDFEEEYLANRLIEKLPKKSLMLDAQLFLHQEAMAVVKRNYRIQMDSIAPEYFYDFLLHHPHVALHFSNWFLRCKPTPPTTGCLIDTKLWALSMMVRGSMTQDNVIDECED